MFPEFEIAAGSIPGRDHVGTGNLLMGRNNQDAWACHIGEEALIAVCCDGCGSGTSSEVGARLGARLLVKALAGHLHENEEAWESARRVLLAHLASLLDGMGCNRAQDACDLFLFTIVAALITPQETTIATLGDGLFALNGAVTQIGPFPGNEPPYLGYDLMERPRNNVEPMRFVIQRQVLTAEVQSLLLATDGAAELIAAAERYVPGQRALVGPISRFWTEDRYFANPDALRRRLALINSEPVRWDEEREDLIREPGLLPDDTTLVVIRRRGD